MTDAPGPTPQVVAASQARRVTIFPTLRGYRGTWLGKDIAAGLAIAAVGLPSAIAYPAIAGLPVETGIYASIGAVIGYAVLGPSRQLIAGPDAATIAVLASVLAGIAQAAPAMTAADLAAGAPLLALAVGLVSFLAAGLRLGSLANLLSRPILTGFLSGVAISIIIGQLGRITGLNLDGDGVLEPLADLARQAVNLHLPSLGLALAMFVVLHLARRWNSRVPGPVIVILLSGALSALFHFEAMGIRIVGDLPEGLPMPRLPSLGAVPVAQLVQGALAVFVVSFGAGIITARGFAARSGEDVEPNVELRGFGAANLLSGLLGGFPVTASDSRTAVNVSVGGRTQAAGLAAAVALVATMIFFGHALRYLPIPALGAILIAAAATVVNPAGLEAIWRISKIEFLFALIAMAGAIGYGVLQGVLVAILATFVYVIQNAMQPRVVLLGRIPGRTGFYKLHRSTETQPVPGLTITFIQGSLLFFNAEHVKQRLREIMDAEAVGSTWFIIDASAITQLDSTGAEMLTEFSRELRDRGIHLGFSEVQSDVALLLTRAGIVELLGRAMFFDDLPDAARAFAAQSVSRPLPEPAEEAKP